MMTIEKGIPLPAKFPFAAMKVGDSFLVEKEITRTAVSVAAKRFGDKNNMKFTVRKSEGHLRCWRLA